MNCCSINCLPSICAFGPPAPPEPTFQEKIAELKARRQKACRETASMHLPSVQIIGAGPAGCIRAIQAMLEGIAVGVLEKRAEDAPGRENAVHLRPEAVAMLEEYAIYHWLREHNLIYPERDGFLCVRLCDLEQAMRTVIRELQADEPGPRVIEFEAELIESTERLRYRQKLLDKEGYGVANTHADVVVYANGSRAGYDAESRIPRQELEHVGPLPVMNAIFKDERPEITDILSFAEYALTSLYYIAMTVYTHAVYFFKHISGNSLLAASVTLTTPGQSYVGAGFKAEGTERLVELIHEVTTQELALEAANFSRSADAPAIAEQLRAAKIARDAFLQTMAVDALCWSNFANTVLSVGKFLGFNIQVVRPLDFSLWLPLRSTAAIEIGADCSKQPPAWEEFGRIYLLAGDAFFTVEPTTGRGCNYALTTSTMFGGVLKCLKEGQTREDITKCYVTAAMAIRNEGFHESARVRHLYRPDLPSIYA